MIDKIKNSRMRKLAFGCFFDCLYTENIGVDR